jgi:hypothetical protein
MPFNPLFMKDVDFTVEAVDYAAELASVLFETDSDQVTWRGLKPTSSFTQATPPTYTCTIRYAQDWDEPASFARFLYDNDGETVAATFVPRDGGPSFTANIQVISGPIGGDVDTYAESTVSLGSDRPVLVPPVV